MEKTKERRPWVREELILAINLYCKLPFGKLDARTPEVQALASLINRTPGALSFKLGNFASIDPTLKRKGLSNVSKLDKQVWQEFFENWDDMIFQSEQLLKELPRGSGKGKFKLAEDITFPAQTEKEVQVKARINQSFFRKMILTSYDSTCCITSLSVSSLLVASHIKPWKDDVQNRTNPMNGLCLNSLHDKAFDRGLISLTDDYKVMLSNKMNKDKSEAVKRYFYSYEGQKITTPNRFLPSKEFLQYHRDVIFQH